MENGLKRTYTLKEFAEIFSVTEYTAREMCREHKVAAMKFGRGKGSWRIFIKPLNLQIQNAVQQSRRKSI